MSGKRLRVASLCVLVVVALAVAGIVTISGNRGPSATLPSGEGYLTAGLRGVAFLSWHPTSASQAGSLLAGTAEIACSLAPSSPEKDPFTAILHGSTVQAPAGVGESASSSGALSDSSTQAGLVFSGRISGQTLEIGAANLGMILSTCGIPNSDVGVPEPSNVLLLVPYKDFIQAEAVLATAQRLADAVASLKTDDNRLRLLTDSQSAIALLVNRQVARLQFASANPNDAALIDAAITSATEVGTLAVQAWANAAQNTQGLLAGGAQSLDFTTSMSSLIATDPIVERQFATAGSTALALYPTDAYFSAKQLSDLRRALSTEGSLALSIAQQYPSIGGLLASALESIGSSFEPQVYREIQSVRSLSDSALANVARDLNQLNMGIQGTKTLAGGNWNPEGADLKSLRASHDEVRMAEEDASMAAHKAISDFTASG